MDDIALNFNEWSEQTKELAGSSNAWMPAYGYQPPVIDKDDLMRAADTDFLLASNTNTYAFLETILEENSDDLQSDGERSLSQCSQDDYESPSIGSWLANDEHGSVVRIDVTDCGDSINGNENESNCELNGNDHFHAKRSKRVYDTISVPDDDVTSLSRSSSLLQFETLEKRCQDMYNSSPSILSTFSYDSLESQKLAANANDNGECGYGMISSAAAKYSFYKSEFQPFSTDFKTFFNGTVEEKTLTSGASSLTESAKSYCESSSDEDSIGCSLSSRVENLTKSYWDTKNRTKETESLSEDSGFCENIKDSNNGLNGDGATMSKLTRTTKTTQSFHAYDGEGAFQTTSASYLGISYQDLSIFDPTKVNAKQTIKKYFKSNAKPTNLGDISEFSEFPENRVLEDFASEIHTSLRGIKNSRDEIASPSLDSVTSSLSKSALNKISLNSFSEPNLNVFSSENIRQISEVASLPNLDWIGCENGSSKSIEIEDTNSRDKLHQIEEVGEEEEFGDSRQSGSYRISRRSIIKYYDNMEHKLIKLKPSDESDDNDDNKVYFRSSDEISKYLDVVDPSKCYNIDIQADIMDFEESLKKAISNSSIPSFNKEECLFNFSNVKNANRSMYSTPNLYDDQSSSYWRGSMTNLLDDDNFSNFTPISLKKLSRSEGKITHGINGILSKQKRSNTEHSNASSTKGVHFCEIVSEVSWLDDNISDYESDEANNTNTDSDDSDDIEQNDVYTDENTDEKTTSASFPAQVENCFDTNKHKQENALASKNSNHNVDGATKIKTFESNQMNVTPTDHVVHRMQNVGKSLTQCTTTHECNRVQVSETRNSEVQNKPNECNERGIVDADVNLLMLNINTNDDTKMNGNNGNVANMYNPQFESVKQTKMDVTSAKNKPKSVKDVGSSNKFGNFLSKFANFRFSMRRTHEKKRRKPNGQFYVDEINEAPKLNVINVTNANNSNEVIHIPLKGNELEEKPHSNDFNEYSRSNFPPMSHVDETNKVITCKPPKHPPRIVGIQEKPPTAQALAATNSTIDYPFTDCKRQSRNRSASQVSRNDFGVHEMVSVGAGHRVGLIETDLDTHITVVNKVPVNYANGKTRSLVNLGANPVSLSVANASDETDRGKLLMLQVASGQKVRPHKSMEFLLDKENLKVVEPPENELQKNTSDRVMSEHQLRVQRSLQKLTVPEWFKPASVPREGFLLNKKRCDTSVGKWTGVSNKTTSLSSLSTGVRATPGDNDSQNSIMLSPTPHSYAPTSGFTRWSTSKLNSTASSPCNSTRSSFSYRQQIGAINGAASPSSSLRSSFNYRQPYLGWRSQERLTRPPRTPAERLATSLRPQNDADKLTASDLAHNAQSEIQSSIKAVSSAIVHYVSGLTPETAAPPDKSYLHISESQDDVNPRSVSPGAVSRGSQKFCWLESSFVGTRPLDSPQTPPVNLVSDRFTSTPIKVNDVAYTPTMHLDLATTAASADSRSNGSLAAAHISRHSPGSTTLEDVLDSLLGLPPSTRAASPSLQEMGSAKSSPSMHDSRQRLLSVNSNTNANYSETPRRSSEGHSERDDADSQNGITRRVSFHSSPLPDDQQKVRCQYPKCLNTATYERAKEYYKHCHNCNFVYCSRECRRLHWDKHRRTCLHSRVNTLCRQIINKVKDDGNILLHVSSIARRGYLSQGPGVVKCFFATPEAAETFVTIGISGLVAEPTYIKHTDLLPSEMGAELFSELIKICQSYNPDARFVLYVAVCVISEAPTQRTVKWERQLVSRCAKLKLSKILLDKTAQTSQNDTLILTSTDGGQSRIGEESLANREANFRNIQKQLRHRGVSLKRQFPDAYVTLKEYAEGKREYFSTITLYPIDAASGKNFLCIIMPHADDGETAAARAQVASTAR